MYKLGSFPDSRYLTLNAFDVRTHCGILWVCHQNAPRLSTNSDSMHTDLHLGLLLNTFICFWSIQRFYFFTETVYLEFVFRRSSNIRFKFYCQNGANILLKIPVVEGTLFRIITSCWIQIVLPELVLCLSN